MPASGLHAASVRGLCGLLLITIVVPIEARQSTPATATATERTRAVDDLFRQWHAPDSPGAAVLVIDDGRIVHARGYGMANLEHGVPNRPDTVFDIASVSKQFAAMSIALLEADGRLSLDDDVRRYLPELGDFGRTLARTAASSFWRSTCSRSGAASSWPSISGPAGFGCSRSSATGFRR